ncbi:hypothetical protein [Nonomuraea sp. B19D2]|uniref:hypothetical protein n=1 Tax=Nonomuraea sp. B19D2 TaxID=3159561 RepID=UPI0032DB8F07
MKTRTLAVALAACLAIGACGSGAFEGLDAGDGPDDTSTRAGDHTTRPKQDPPAGKQRTKYGFTLPIGNTSVDVNEGQVYDALAEGDCPGAQTALDQTKGNFRSATTVPLFQAGVYLCRKDVASAKSEYAGLVWEGSDVWFICELRRAVGSVVQQKPKSAFGGCPPVEPLPSSPDDSPDPAESPDPGQTPDPAETPETGSGTGTATATDTATDTGSGS